MDAFRRTQNFPTWEFDKNANAQVSKGKIGKHTVTLVLPDTFMNNSGKALKKLKVALSKSSQLIVVHDDLDVPLRGLKISFARGSGGHHGLDSIIKELKSKNFVRFRVGISPVFSGVMEKPKGEGAVHNYLMQPFDEPQYKALVQLMKKIDDALLLTIERGYVHAMNACN